MKKVLVLALIVVGACSRTPAPGNQLTGAGSPRLAAEAFMQAVKAQDLQAMSVVWGTEKGAARDQLDRAELDKRLILIQSCYAHDSYKIVEETPGQNGRRYVRVSVQRGRTTRTPNFEMVQAGSGRWYVENADFAAVQGLCRQPS